MECSVPEKIICKPVTAVAVTLIHVSQASRRAGEAQEGWLQPLPYTGLNLLPACPGAVYRSGLSFTFQRWRAIPLWHFPLCSVLLLASNSWSLCSAKGFLRNFSLTHNDVVSETLPVPAAVFLSELLAFPGVWLEMLHLGKGKPLVICVTCVMGSIWSGGCWFGTTELMIIIQTTYHFI